MPPGRLSGRARAVVAPEGVRVEPLPVGAGGWAVAIHVVCLSCGRSGKVPDRAAGHEVTCPSCGFSFRLGPADAPEPEPESEPVAVDRPVDLGLDLEVPDLPVRGRDRKEPARPPATAKAAPTALYVALGAFAAATVGLLGVIAVLLGLTPVAPAPQATAAIPVAAVPSPAPSAQAPVDRPLSTAEVVERAEPSVALIDGALSSGTGFLVAPGVLATNAHVIASELIPGLRVRFPSAPEGEAGPRPATLIAEDTGRDLAFLRVATELPPLPVDAAHRYVKGEDVLVIGNPGVGGALVLENAVSRGVMSSRATIDGNDYVQLGIAINPGNSGGPVLDARGRVIGVATLKTAEEESLGFCIPAEDLRRGLDAAIARSPAAGREARDRHRPRAVFHLLTAAGAVHALGLDEHVYAWDDERGASIDRLIGDHPKLREIRATLDALHDRYGVHLDAEAARLATDRTLDGETRDLFARYVASYGRFRTILARPPGDFATLLRLVSNAEADHLALTKTLGDRLGAEVDVELLAALAPLQEQGPSRVDAGSLIDGLPGLPPDFGGFRDRLPGPGRRLGPGMVPGFGTLPGSVPRPPDVGPFFNRERPPSP